MADNIKQAVIETDAYDEVLFSAEPKYYRSLPGELPNRLVQLTDEGKSKKEITSLLEMNRQPLAELKLMVKLKLSRLNN